MARLKFVAAGHHNQVCEAFGRQFLHGEWVDAAGMDPQHVKTLAANPTFEAELDPEPEAPKASGRNRGKAAAEAPAADPDAAEDA